jgi:hypothetical protein
MGQHELAANANYSSSARPAATLHRHGCRRINTTVLALLINIGASMF